MREKCCCVVVCFWKRGLAVAGGVVCLGMEFFALFLRAAGFLMRDDFVYFCVYIR